MGLGWGVAQVAPGRDRTAYDWLAENDLELFYPTVAVKRRIRYRGRTHITEAIIPGYVFVRLDPDAPREEQVWRHTVGHKGVEGYLGGNPERPYQIPDQTIDDFRSRFFAGEFVAAAPPPLDKGELVRMETGHFSGHWGVVEDIKNQIAELKAKLFGRETSIFLPVDCITRVAAC